MRIIVYIIVAWVLTHAAVADQKTVTLVTLNCYWFMGQEESQNSDPPCTTGEYSLKAGHLIGLLTDQAPLFVGFQEVGNDGDVQALAHAATKRFRRAYQTLFIQGKDTSTRQDVGAILDLTQGWGVNGRASRVSDLEKELSKHLVVRITNAVTSMDICVVHLRRPMGADGEAKQIAQCRALLRWAMRHLSTDPKANLVILGDFNEGQPVGSSQQSLAVLFQTRPPIVDSFSLLSGKISTHVDKKAYDRILLSDAIVNARNELKLERVTIQEHRYVKGEERRLYTDHYPVVATLKLER